MSSTANLLVTQGVLYEAQVTSLSLGVGGAEVDMTPALTNGRSSYIIFEMLVRQLCGLAPAAGSDHVDATGRLYEQKSFVDAANDPTNLYDLFHTAASSTFGANNKGPVVKALLAADDYAGALQVCKDTGYSKNDFYIYTNTGRFTPSVPLRFIIVKAGDVLANLDASDPRLLSRNKLLGMVKKTVQL